MAGYDTTRLGKGARRHAQAVGALAVFILCLACSSAALAAYGVITARGLLATSCYHIQDNRLILCNGEELNLQDVIAIDAAGLTPQERVDRQAAMEKCLQRLDVLTQEDARIRALENRNHEVLEYIVGLRSSSKPSSRIDDALADALLTLEKLEEDSRKQKQAWEQVKMPDMIFLPLREIKLLQYTSRILSYQEWRLYLKHGDITLREYAREHSRQALAFEERFQARLVDLRVKTASAALDGAEVNGDDFWRKSEAPEPIIIPKIFE